MPHRCDAIGVCQLHLELAVASLAFACFGLIAPNAATTSIWEKGRRYLIMVVSPAEGMSAGLLDLAAGNGLKTLALINQDAWPALRE